MADVQIEEYDGAKLGSIEDFRENSIKGPQTVDIETYKLTVDGLVENPASYTYDEVLANQNCTKLVTLYCVEGWDVKILWEGILLKDLFEKSTVQSQVNTVIFHSPCWHASILAFRFA